MPLKQSYSSPSQTKFWTMIREAAATENLQTFLPTSFKTMNESSRCVFLSRALKCLSITACPNPPTAFANYYRSPISDQDDPGEDYPFDAPNRAYVPQSGTNSPVYTPDTSDDEGGYRVPVRRLGAMSF